jgi:DNA invertase Pin-like site-specific DNA recombinase
MANEFSQKITAAHLTRIAILYIRQSSMQQVFQNQESTRLQYALKERLVVLGWPEDMIKVVDCDLGLSGSGSEKREGFKSMLADVSNGEVGAVACIECSRLSRKVVDWGNLTEICAITKTLLIDGDGVYDPSDFNDGLLLGLKGTMSAAELHFLRARMRGGALNKAARGEYRTALPAGYIYDEMGRVVKEPNLQIQAAVSRIFEVFRSCGSAGRTALIFKECGYKFPKGDRYGFYGNKTEWVDLSTSRARYVLKNATYAGVYGYGKKQSELTVTGTKCRFMQPEKWHTYIQDHHEGYISLQEFERNQEQMKSNCHHSHSNGPAREGSALLQGIAICGLCGARMSPVYQYRNEEKVVHRYRCTRSTDMLADKCTFPSVHGPVVDAAVEKIILDKLTPDAIMMAAQVRKEVDKRKASDDQYFAMQVKDAEYREELARRRYTSVDPENRLVAAELERLWECSIKEFEVSKEAYRKHEVSKKDSISGDDIEKLLSLPDTVPELWKNNGIAIRDKKRMLRCLVKDVTLTKTGKNIDVSICFSGGATCVVQCRTPLNFCETRATSDDVIEAIRWEADCHTTHEIANILNKMGLQTGTGIEFTDVSVRRLMQRHNILTLEEHMRSKGYLTLQEQAEKLGIKWRELYYSVTQGRYDGKFIRASENGKFLFAPN